MILKKIIPIVLFGLALTFTMCSKDDDDTPVKDTYVGKWHSDPFDFAGTSVVMNYEFEETNFETIIKAPGGAVPMMGVKGDVDPGDGNKLSISITDLGSVNQSGSLDWYNRVDDAQMFDGIYTTSIQAFMPKDFDAVYEITGDQMDLIIPVANDTLILFR